MAEPTESPAKTSLALDVEAVRRNLGPVKVALIEQWIREVVGPFDAAIAPHVRPDSVVLDIGCSRGDPDLPALTRGRLLAGVDVDMPGLRANTIASVRVCAPMGRLPFADASCDVIVAKWVAEHLRRPLEEFAECRRVLKPGGVLCLLTPNANSIFTLASRATPYRLKQLFKGRLFGIHEEDTFRTYYRANTRRQLRRHFEALGFETVHFVWMPGMWTFLIFNRVLARCARALEQVQARLPGARAMSTYIIGVWRKP